MDWSIQEVARLAGTTSRTLRHYGDVGLLAPSRTGDNGYRYYDQTALVRLQRILLLRQLGLGLPAIGEVLDGERDDASALLAHLEWLRSEQRRIADQISSVQSTIDKLKGGEQLMAEEMLNGFDHTQYKEEVVDRWGADAYASGDKWWRAKTGEEKAAFLAEQAALAAEWADAAARALDPAGTEAHELARRQYGWLSGIPGTPGYPAGPTKEYFVGLGELYVSDERFGANYGGTEGAAFVRDAMTAYAEREL
ncbi:TipAS antibiotic-recognition domain-containing protein [Conyzicola nivalis]|uniref:MerR family transcriptional regulator n=1 Tax=Conyzicola nivalis TaxID=1477021 RepID=A0A916SRA4_9MICO|nr:TipAS antibiotic-recognition domain-containing protein [Conyzicola nivalis]GGB09794.1 MerR family transcriptional regulator [Conyzicola nivalis]